jgi:iron complex outermembrane receptor protein
MSIEIRKVVRQILAPMAAVVPCMALMAAAPAIAAAQNGDQSSSSQVTSISPKKLKQVTIVAAQEAVATVSPTKFEHVSPGTSVVQVLNNVPGFNSRALGVGGFVVSGSAFTLDGFHSDELGTTYDGVPDINTFLGGLYGQGDQPIGQPIVAMDLAGANVYSGASTQSQASIDNLGGTISFMPALPTPQFHVDVSATGGEYTGGGSMSNGILAVNSGAIGALDGMNVLAKFGHTLLHGPWDNVVERLNSFYLAAVQPTSSGEAKLIVAVNNANGQPPTNIPAPVLAQYGHYYNWPMNVSYTNQATDNTFVDLSVKSLMNSYMIGEVKAFYVSSNNDRIAWSNPIYNNHYAGYSYDLNDTLKSCSALNGYNSSTPVPGQPFPETYDCATAEAMFGSPAAGTAYQHYMQNYAEWGAKTNLTLLLPDNTVQLGLMGIQAPMLSEESWFGNSSAPIGTTGYNMAWLEHDGQTWVQGYLEDNISLLNHKLHIYPGVTYYRLAMFANDDQGYYYNYSGEVSETYKWVQESLGANYAFTPQLNVYLNWGTSTKPPNISALYGNIGASPIPVPPSVVPEKVNNIDAGIRFKNARYEWEVAFFNRNFQNIFSSNYSDITGITTTKNAGAALFRGFTLKGGVILPRHLELTGNFGYTSAKYTKNFTDVNGVAFTDGMPRANVPEETANLDLVYSHGPWYGSLNYHYIGSEYVASKEYGITCTPDAPVATSTGAHPSTCRSAKLSGYGTLNLNGSYLWAIDGGVVKSVKLDLHVDNLLNNQSPFYSSGFDQASTPGFLWQVYNLPLFVGVTATASFF